MTTIENPITEKMNGSSRMTTATDSPWWLVRPSLAAALVASFATTMAVYRFAETRGPLPTMSVGSIGNVLLTLSSTPALIGFALFAFALMLRRKSGRLLRVLSVVLATSSLAGATYNFTRDAHGRGPIETWVDREFASLPELLARS